MEKSLWLTDNVGIIDSDYRGEIVAFMKATTDTIPAVYKQGERFCQLVIVPIPEYTITEVSELSSTERGDGGFGSTGTGHETNLAQLRELSHSLRNRLSPYQSQRRHKKVLR